MHKSTQLNQFIPIHTLHTISNAGVHTIADNSDDQQDTTNATTTTSTGMRQLIIIYFTDAI